MVAWSVGEILWDVFHGHEQLGGAPLNFSANLRRLGDDVTLVSAVGKDERGQVALERMRVLGLKTECIQEIEGLATGTAMVSTGGTGEASFLIPRPAAFDSLSINSKLFSSERGGSVDWLYFGTLAQTDASVEDFVAQLVAELAPARCFYDINLRTGHWNLALVQRLCQLATVLKLNEAEAETLFDLTRADDRVFSLELFCAAWAKTYGIEVICVTLGPAGCLVYDKDVITRVAAYAVTVCDTVGAGDAFAAGFLHGYSQGWPIEKTARFANALGALVASRAGATPDWTVDEVMAMVRA